MFDGYCGPNTHAAIVHLTSSHVFQGGKEHFLSNTKNKELLISLLRDALELNKCATEQVVGDADLSIVTTTLATVTSTRKPTVLVGDDTDLLILLWHHSITRTNNVFFRPQPKAGTKHPPHCWNIAELQGILGEDVCSNIIFMHAVLGCTQLLMCMV